MAGLALMCANRFMSFFKKKKYKYLLNALLENEVGMNVVLDYGRFVTGYMGNMYKLDEIFISETFTRCNKLFTLINYEKPSILLMEDYYELLDEKVRKLFYPCHLLYWNDKILYLLRQYFNYKSFSKGYKDQFFTIKKKIKFKISKIIDERTKIEKLYNLNSKDITEMIMENRQFIYNIGNNIPTRILEKISHIFALILSWEYNCILDLYNKIGKIDVNKISDFMLIKQIVQFEAIVRKVKKEKVNYTINLN